MKSNALWLWIGLGTVVVVGGIWWAVSASNAAPGQYDAFAQCLTDNGVTFYGAWWCPHCQNQKKLFGSSFKNIDYVECSTADGKGQLPVCKDAKVESYPTWEFADGSRVTGEMSLRALSDRTQCTLPGDTNGNANATGDANANATGGSDAANTNG